MPLGFKPNTSLAMVLAAASVQAQAVSFLSFDARSLSMGGTGVVTALSHNASLFNPALLTQPDPSGHQPRLKIHSYVGARLLDRDNFLQAADDFSDKYGDTDLKTSLTSSLNLDDLGFSSGNDLRRTTAEVRTLQSDINNLSDKPLRASASYGVSFGYRNRGWALGGYHRRFLVVGSVVRIADEDNASVDRVTGTIDGIADLFDQVVATRELVESLESLTLSEIIAQTERLSRAAIALNEYVDFNALLDDVRANPSADRDFENFLREPLPREFQSTIETQGADVTEQAISLARSFALTQHHLHLGLTLKQVQYTSIHFVQRINEFDLDVHDDPVHRQNTTRFNLDAGLVHDLSGPWQWGLVVRNLIPRSFHTVLGDEIKQTPIARAGLGYQTQALRISLDLDLTSNEPLGFDPDKQYMSIGAEWFLWRNTALRAGLRHNAVDGETLPSVGIGLGGRRGHLDLGLAKSANGDEWGLALQAGMAF